MKIYLVGGAVRDGWLHRQVKERDWVVVGETPASMLSAGFQQVGKDFPVFLHPVTKEEYALARKERKVSQGYHGFEFDVTASVTLEEDLLRRDLTINAMAQDAAGNIIDPYHGIKDLEAKVLRHVSRAFIEDPVRILRLARFAARFFDFSVAEETLDLMKHMVLQGEVNALVKERVWKEFEKAMDEPAPWRFIEVLESCGALDILFPLFGQYKKEIVLRLQHAKILRLKRFDKMVLLLKAIPASKALDDFCISYPVPQALREMLSLLQAFEPQYHRFLTLSAEEILQLFHGLDGFRRPDRLKHWISLCQWNEEKPAIADNIVNHLDCISKIELSADILKKYSGKELGQYIEKQRLARLMYACKT